MPHPGLVFYSVCFKKKKKKKQEERKKKNRCFYTGSTFKKRHEYRLTSKFLFLCLFYKKS